MIDFTPGKMGRLQASRPLRQQIRQSVGQYTVSTAMD
jgi:hypothetical protein